MTEASGDKAPQLKPRTNDDDGVLEDRSIRCSSPSNSSNSTRKRTVRIRSRTKPRPESTLEDRSRSGRNRSGRQRQLQQPNEEKEKSSSSQRQRRVSFELGENAGVRTHVRRIRSRSSFSQDDINQLWWQTEELENIFRREQDTFEIFSKCCPNYKESVIRLWEKCKITSDNSSLSASSRNHNKNNDAAPVKMNDNSQSSHGSQASCKSTGTSTTTTTSSTASTSNRSDEEKIAGAPARGMENDVVVSIMPGCREEAIRCVIDTQRALARSSPKVRINTVRRRYSNISRAASLFAQNIAGGDAQVAAALYDKDSSSVSSHQRLDGRMD